MICTILLVDTIDQNNYRLKQLLVFFFFLYRVKFIWTIILVGGLGVDAMCSYVGSIICTI